MSAFRINFGRSYQEELDPAKREPDFEEEVYLRDMGYYLPQRFCWPDDDELRAGGAGRTGLPATATDAEANPCRPGPPPAGSSTLAADQQTPDTRSGRVGRKSLEAKAA